MPLQDDAADPEGEMADNGGAAAAGDGVVASGFHIDPYRSVLVRDVGVVDDPARTQDPCLSTNSTNISQKYWFFGYLLTQMAYGSTTTAYSDFARSWLRSWETSTTLNNDSLVAVRPTSGPITKSLPTRIREAWERKSGSTTLAMSQAPFRLLAIVNRFDLRKSPRRFGEGASGELRFVFSPLDLDGEVTSYVVLESPPIRLFDGLPIGARWHDRLLHRPSGASAASLSNRWRRRGRRVEADGLAGGLDDRVPKVLGDVDLFAKAGGEGEGHVHEAAVPLADQHLCVPSHGGVHGVAGHVPAVDAVAGARRDAANLVAGVEVFEGQLDAAVMKVSGDAVA